MGLVESFKKLSRYASSFLFPGKIEEGRSSVSGKLEVHYVNGKYMLDTANVNYSFGGLHTVFQKAFGQFNIRQRKLSNALVLGFGAGSVASILQNEYGKEVSITGVEKDEAVIELAKKYFSIGQYKNLDLQCMDACDYVLGPVTETFDLVVVDIFVDLLVPEKVQDEKFISGLGRLLSENGILFYNFIARDDKTRDAGGKLFKLLSSNIGNTEWVRIFATSTENWVFVCDRSRNGNKKAL